MDIGAFHWRPLRLDIEARNIVIHGDEQPNEEPYARIEDLKVDFSILGFWSPTIRLRGLDVIRPRLHLIFYPDGATNQPRPAHPQKAGNSGIQTLFDLKAGRVNVADGMIHLDNRAASLDFQDRYQPLDFRANDVTFDMKYVYGGPAGAERYHLDTSVRDITLTREGTLHGKVPPVHGVIQAALDLERNALRLNYSNNLPARIDEGVRRLAKVFRPA